MRRPLLPALLLTGCITSQEDPVPPPLSELPAFSATVCVVMFPGHTSAEYRASCPQGQEQVAIGFAVAPIKGECEPAIFSLHGFQQIWGCR